MGILTGIKERIEDNLEKKRRIKRELQPAKDEQEKISRAAYEKEKIVLKYEKKLADERRKVRRQIARDREREEASKK
jgi:predicted nucleotidyltransferase